MDDLSWMPYTNNEIFTAQRTFTRADSAPPSSGVPDMRMANDLDQMAAQMSMAQTMSGLYSATEASQHNMGMEFNGDWTADLTWISSNS
jgi:hypothetical protein